MGGIIVIDFIDMHSNDHKQMLYEKMKEIMAKDRAKNHILPLSKFGLMQITRQRVRPEMNIDVLEKCPACNGTGEISPSILLMDEIESRLSLVVQNNEDKTIIIKVHPYIAAYIRKGLFSQRFKWAMKFHRTIKVSSSMSMHLTGYRFYNKKNQELKFN
jgi:ribonuclease G